MGSFLGHAAPGLFLILFSIWWTFACLNRYYRAKYKAGRKYRSSVAFVCSCGGNNRKYPIESVMKVVCAIIGIIGEVVNAVDGSGHFVYVGNAQHITMYALFGFSGVIDIMMHYGAPLPPNSDYCYALLSFIGQALLFQYHVHVHSSLAIAMHKLLCYTIWASMLSFAAEMRWPHNVLCTLARCFFVGVQGTWFWQIGIYLYILERRKITVTPEIEDLVELVAIYYCWHMFAVFIFIVFVALAVNKIHRPRSDGGFLMRDDKYPISYDNASPLLSDSDEEISQQASAGRDNNNHFDQEAIGLLPRKSEDGE